MTSLLISVVLSFGLSQGDAPPPPVGFVVHRTAPHHEALSRFPATAELSDVVHWDLREHPKDVLRLDDIALDPAKFDDWYANLAASDRVAYPIIDTSVHHTNIPWRQTMTREIGENFVGFDSRIWDFSSLHSPLFRESVRRYAKAVTDWVASRDEDRRIAGYLGGAEWFYPGSLDYSPLALHAFAQWLEAKYGDLDALNAAWGAHLSDWSEADPPRHWMIGDPQVGMRTFGINGAIDMGWFTPRVPVTPGELYDASAIGTLEGIPEGLSVMAIVWFDADGGVLRTDAYAPEAHIGCLEARVRCPERAAQAALLFKAMAPGAAFYRAAAFRLAGTDKNLLPPPVSTADGVDGWHFGKWHGEGRGRIQIVDDAVVVHIEVDPQPMPYEATGVALEDFVTFSFEAMAAWLDESAAHIKQLDPTRPVISYIGFIFGQPVLWDYASIEQRLDISLANTPQIDVNGFQICIADEDFTYAAANIDLARKYDKPMWCTDLIDFPYGHYSGFQAIYRGSLACVQHGMTGFFWYCWTGVPDYAYFEHLTSDELTRLLRDVRAASEAIHEQRLVTRAAQLMPVMTYSLADPGGRKGDPFDNAGLHHLLQDCGITPDVYTPYEVARRGAKAFDGYDVVFLSDCPVLPAPVHAALAAFIDRGGVLVASGQLPERDLAGAPLPALDLGSGRVVRLGDRVGRAYWGKVRLEAVHGNTPPVYVEVDDPARTPFARMQGRKRLADALTNAGISLPVRLDPDRADVHVSVFHNAAEGSYTVFALNREDGRAHKATVDLDLPDLPTAGRAWADFDKRGEVAVENGRITLPDFSHACLVQLGGADPGAARD